MQNLTDTPASSESNTNRSKRDEPRFHKRFSSVVIKALHTKVAGRARLHINILYHQPKFETILAKQLSAITNIRSAQTSVRTGNVLIQYDPALSVDELLLSVRKATNRAITSARYSKQESLKIIRKTEEHFAEDIINWIQEQLESYQETVNSRRQAKHKPLRETPKSEWHSNPINQIIATTATDMEYGITADDATRRLADYGPNELPKIDKRSELSILIGQFTTVPVAMLATSALVSIATGGLLDAGVIMSVVAINAAIGFFTERQAEQTINALTRPGPRYARVMRGGELCEVPHKEVTIGDVLLLSPGDFVAADGRILKSQRFTIDESALTGESVPVRKSAALSLIHI